MNILKIFRRVVAQVAAPPKLHWPDTTPIDFNDPYWKFNNNMFLNGINYKKTEVAGKWQWVVDEAAEERKRKRRQAQSELVWACRSRILTDEEMDRVYSYGVDLVIYDMVSFNKSDKEREFNDLLFQQQRLRALKGV